MFKLRDYQKECVDCVIEDLNTYKRLGAVLPTGSGKTEIFTEIVSQYLKKNPKKVVLVMSHLDLLTKQTEDRINLRAPDIKTGVLQGKLMPESSAQVVISTMQSARIEDKILSWRTKSKAKVGLIIVDECHFLTTASYEKALSYFPRAKLLGVTATPFREAQLMTNFFDRISYTVSMQELIEREHLVPPDLNQIIMPKDADVVERIARCVDIYTRSEMGRKAVVFMNTIEDAENLRNAFVDVGVSAAAVTCNITGDYREDVLDEFRNGDLNVLTTVNVLSAGFDAPCLEVIIMPYKTSSPTLFMQRTGRALRPYFGKDKARIYCFGDAPSIKRGMYTNMMKKTLDIGHKDEKPDVYSEMDFLELIEMDKNSTEYKWTEQMCDIADRLRDLRFEGLHDLVRFKNFPQRYMRNLPMLLKALESIKEPELYSPITDSQKRSLSIQGFNEDHFDVMTYGDAKGMLEIIGNMRSAGRDSEETKWIVPSGKMMGKHVKDLPYPYIQAVLRYHETSYIAKLIKNWYEYKKGL